MGLKLHNTRILKGTYASLSLIGLLILGQTVHCSILFEKHCLFSSILVVSYLLSHKIKSVDYREKICLTNTSHHSL